MKRVNTVAPQGMCKNFWAFSCWISQVEDDSNFKFQTVLDTLAVKIETS